MALRQTLYGGNKKRLGTAILAINKLNQVDSIECEPTSTDASITQRVSLTSSIIFIADGNNQAKQSAARDTAAIQDAVNLVAVVDASIVTCLLFNALAFVAMT